MGTGVTPFISILERIYANKDYLANVNIQMFYGVRNDDSSFYYEEFLTKFFAESHATCGS
jgi:sulfite reductase alpha subunit-like flavoprotein